MNTTTSGVATAICFHVTLTEGVPGDARTASPPAIPIMSGTQCPPLRGGSDHSRANVRGRALWLMTPHAPDIDALIAELLNRPIWHRGAACSGLGTESFFPTSGGVTKEARAVCDSCPVSAPCLRAALEDPLTVGVWAGTSVRGRAALREAEAEHPQVIPVRSHRRLAG